MVNFVVVVVVVVVVVARGRHGAARRRLWRALSVPSTVVEGERTFFNWICEARVHFTKALAMCIVCMYVYVCVACALHEFCASRKVYMVFTTREAEAARAQPRW